MAYHKILFLEEVLQTEGEIKEQSLSYNVFSFKCLRRKQQEESESKVGPALSYLTPSLPVRAYLVTQIITTLLKDFTP